MDLLLCGMIYHGDQKHLGRLKCRSGVLESLDQQELGSSMRADGARPRKGGEREGKSRGKGKKRGMIER